MPKLLQKRWYGYQTVWVFMLELLLVIFVSYYNWILGLVSLCLVGGFVITSYSIHYTKLYDKNVNKQDRPIKEGHV